MTTYEMPVDNPPTIRRIKEIYRNLSPLLPESEFYKHNWESAIVDNGYKVFSISTIDKRYVCSKRNFLKVEYNINRPGHITITTAEITEEQIMQVLQVGEQ